MSRTPVSARWLLAAVIAVALAYITLNSVRSHSAGSRGLPAGAALPPFALPLSSSSCRGPCDANVATRAGQGAAGARPACSVRGPGVLNSCALAASAPAVLAFVFAPVSACRAELDVLDAARLRYPAVHFAAVLVRADGPAARRFVASGGWKLPIGYDHDAAVADAYAVVVCPTITYLARGGRVAGSTVGPVGSAELARWVRRIGGA